MIQVTKVWWDGEKLMAEPIDPTTIHQEPAQEKDWGAVGEAHIAAIKKSSKAMVEDAAVRAVHKVMAEFEAKSDERLMGRSAQPSKQWVGLTDEELNSVVPYCHSEFDLNEFREFAFAIGKLLKEKNT